ncbi:MAG: hypothetical protein EOM37_12525 [Proteobacteria bacterium]|nr:hypothetical protein [Pseudomonadota bacterium]
MSAKITNRVFIETMVGHLPDGVVVPVTSIKDPTVPGWTAFALSPGQDYTIKHGLNSYFCLASHKKADPQPRKKESFVALYVVMLDDVCTKVQQNAIKLKATYAIETSKGNFQLGFRLSEPVTDLPLVDRLSRAIIKKGLSDPGAGGLATRYARLPQGWNTKRDPLWECRLVTWRPELAYTLQELIDGLDLELEPEKQQARPCQAIKAPESSAYVRKALEDECAAVAAMLPNTGRNNRLNQASFSLGQFVGGRALSEGDARLALEQAAAACGLTEEEPEKTSKTIESGLTAGMADPRQIPEGESDWNPDGGQRAGKSKFVNSYVRVEELDAWTPTVKVWPRLEQAALHGIVGEFVDLATEGSEADPAAVLATTLVRFGVEAGSPDPNARPHIYVGESRHEPRIFGVVVGKSAKARKGTSGAPVTRLFAVPEGCMGAPKMAPMNLGPLSSGEGIVYAVRDAQETWDDKEQQFKVIDPGVLDKRLFVQEEEFAAAINAGKRDGNTLSATLRALWDSGTRSPMTKTSRTQCTNAHVGILAHITIDELAVSLSACDKLNGYANRFLWMLARRSKRVPRPRRMPDDKFIPIRNEIWQRLHLAHAAGQMRLTAAAGDLWDAEYDRLTEDRPGIAGAITARAEAQVVRLSMIYALCDGRKQVDAVHVQAALALWRYAQASAEFIFSDDAVGSKLDAKIHDLLLKTPAGSSLTDLHNATGKNHKAEELHRSIQRLVDAGLVRSESIKTDGAVRSKTVFFSNEVTNFTNLRSYPDGDDDTEFVNSLNSYVRTDEIPDEVTI